MELTQKTKVAFVGIDRKGLDSNIDKLNVEIYFNPDCSSAVQYDVIFTQMNYGLKMKWALEQREYDIYVEQDHFNDAIVSFLYYAFGFHLIGLDAYDILSNWGEKRKYYKFLLNTENFENEAKEVLDTVEKQYGISEGIQMLFNGDVGIAAVTDVVEYLYEKMEKNKPMIYTIGDYSQEEGVAEMNIWI